MMQALDRIPQPAQQPHARIARIGEYKPPRHAHADHLVVDDIGRHTDQRQVPEPLADRFMRGGMGNEMREAFERDARPVGEVAGDRIVKS